METSDYHPVMLSVMHPHPELELWVAERFEALNHKKVQIIRKADLPAEAQNVYPPYAKAWLWDLVPDTVERIMFIDFDLIPLRALPPLPDAPFLAVPDTPGYVDHMRGMYPHFAKTRHVFNSGFFVAHRDTRACFERLKSFAITIGYDLPYGLTYEQTPMNHLIQADFDVHWLPKKFHCLAHTHYFEVSEGYMLHLTGVGNCGRWTVMELFRGLLGTAPIGGK